jgi:hypothetical protein
MRYQTSSKTRRCAHRIVAASLVAFFAIVAPIPAAVAAPLPVARYDITDTPLSGFGCWQHVYNGTIALTGRTVIGCGNDPPVPIANYTGGGGTLNDGVIGTSYLDNHLFTITSFDGGPPFNPVITLYLAAPGIVNHIRIHGGDDSNNATPGSIERATVEIGGVAVEFATTPSGSLNYYGIPVDDDIDLSGSALAGMVTDRIVLRDFSASLTIYGEELFSITEITVDGDLVTARFAGTPGKANCHGKSVSSLAGQYGGMATAASMLGFPSVQELQKAIKAFCQER